MIVLLNGTSSAGRTSLARALQRRWPGPLLAVGIDTVVFALPGRWLDPPGWHEVFVYTGSGDDLRITPGPLGDRLVAGLHRRFQAVHAHTRYDLEVDTSTGDPETCADLVLAATGSAGPARLR